MIRTTVTATVFAALATLPSFHAKAEYRAYELLITHEPTGRTRTVISTLDDIQYRDYHHLLAGETVSIRATWMCWRRSDHFTPICPNSTDSMTPGAPPGPTANSDTSMPALPQAP